MNTPKQSSQEPKGRSVREHAETIFTRTQSEVCAWPRRNNHLQEPNQTDKKWLPNNRLWTFTSDHVFPLTLAILSIGIHASFRSNKYWRQETNFRTLINGRLMILKVIQVDTQLKSYLICTTPRCIQLVYSAKTHLPCLRMKVTLIHNTLSYHVEYLLPRLNLEPMPARTLNKIRPCSVTPLSI